MSSKSQRVYSLEKPSIFALALLVSFVVVFGVACLIAYNTCNKAINHTIRSNETRANLLAKIILEHQRAAIGVLRSYGNRPLLVDSVKRKDFEEVINHLTSLVKNNPEIEITFITDPGGTLWANFPIFKEAFKQNLSYRDWYKGVIKEWTPYVSSVYKMIVGEKDLAVAVCSPIRDEKGKVIGILAGVQTTGFFKKIVKEAGLDVDVKITLIDQEGHIIYSNRFPYKKEVVDYPLFEFVKKAMKGEKGDVEIRDSFEGHRIKYVSFAPVEGIGWSVIVEKGRREVLQSEFIYLIQFGVISFLVFTVFAFSLVYLREKHKQMVALRTLNAELAKTNEELRAEIIKCTHVEETLRGQSKILEAFFTSTITPLVFLDRDFNFIRVNEAYAKACQRDISEFQGHNHFEFYPSDSREIFEQVVETKVPYQAIARPFSFPDHPEWRTTYWDWTLTPLLGDKGEVEFLVFSLEDVTERKRAEGEAQAQYSLRKSIENSIMTGILVADLNGKITHVNPAFCRMIGWSEKELVGSIPPFVFWPPEDMEICARTFQTVLSSRTPTGTFEARLRRKNEGHFDVLILASPFKDGQGKVSGWVASIGDITDRKETERRIRATNVLLNLFSKVSARKEYLDAVVGLIRGWSDCQCVGIRLLDEQGTIPYESYVGFTQKFWESENLLSIKKDQCACIRVITGNPDPQDASAMTPAGSFHCDNLFKFIGNLSEEEKSRFRGVCMENGFLSVSIVPIRYREKVLGVIHLADQKEGQVPVRAMEFIESITPLIGEATNRFALEDELRESESRLRHLSSQLLTVQENERRRIAMEVHDSIGQSLSAIKFRVESVIEQVGNRDKILVEPLQSITSLVKQSIEESRRIQADLRPPILDDLGILPTLSWFCRQFQNTYTGISIEKKTDIEEDEIPDSLKTVIYRISQEALNNIAKHSGADFVHLSLRKSDSAIELVIQDNGRGFDLNGITSKYSSMRGLGLSSMRERAELSGGSLFIESSGGMGTIIRALWSSTS